MSTIYRDGEYRITQRIDECASLKDLKGDCFDPTTNPDIDPDRLADEERKFERAVNEEGVYGYVLERWNLAVDVGWEHIDSCWGFVGQYDPTSEAHDHYIVAELKARIVELKAKA